MYKVLHFLIFYAMFVSICYLLSLIGVSIVHVAIILTIGCISLTISYDVSKAIVNNIKKWSNNNGST